MNFSPELQSYCNKKFPSRLEMLGAAREEYEQALLGCDPEEELLLKFELCALPLSDLGDYSADYFLAEVRHGLFLRSNVEWCRELPEHLFLLYVLCPRINNEELRECRRFFFDLLYPRIRNLSLSQAILEVNRWCAEQATYRTTDDRTASPLAVYSCGYGRCGEESAFLTAVLRSVGIASRQVYAPLWSHCDDNHAWVEAYDGEGWKFLGACEPEPALNLGWFTHAASRAMLELTRAFAPGDPEEVGFLFPRTRREDLLLRQGVAYENVTSGYGETRPFTVRVERDGKPWAHGQVSLRILNMAELGEILSLPTDENGALSVNLGLGTVLVTARDGEALGEALCDLREQGSVTLRLGETRLPHGDFSFFAPVDSPKNVVSLSAEQKSQRAAGLKGAAALRESRPREAWNKPGSPEEERFLSQLSEKDRAFSLQPGVWKDARLSLAFQADFPQELFDSCVLNQRIGLEPLSPWRERLSGIFTKEKFSAPRQVHDWIEKNVKTDLESYPALQPTPLGVLRLGRGSQAGKDSLFVAALRTLGIPARLSPLDRKPEYWEGGSFRREASLAPECSVTIRAPRGMGGVYHQNWAMLRLPSFEALELGDVPAGESRRFQIPSGDYVLLTTQRLPAGDQLAHRVSFSLTKSEERKVELKFREIRLDDLLEELSLPSLELVPLRENQPPVNGGGLQAVCWLEPSREPTEHILNELREAAESYQAAGLGIQFILQSKQELEDPTLQKVLQALPQAGLWLGDFENDGAMLARRLYLNPDRLPMIYLSDGEGTARYACCGYNVGTARLLLRMAE